MKTPNQSSICPSETHYSCFWMDSLKLLDFSSFIIFSDDPWSLLVSFRQLFKLPLVVQCCDVICEWPHYSVVRKIYLYIDQLSSLHLVFLNVMITAKNWMCSMIMAACLPVALHIIDIQICDLYKQFKLHWKLCPSPTLYTLRTWPQIPLLQTQERQGHHGRGGEKQTRCSGSSYSDIDVLYTRGVHFLVKVWILQSATNIWCKSPKYSW